jgi:Calcineurin-like phosphoesterase
MGRIRQSRDPRLSLWQAAVDEVVAKRKRPAQALDVGGIPPAIRRPDTDDAMVHAVTAFCAKAESGQPVPDAPPAGPQVTEGLGDVALYCANVALKLGEALGRALLGGDQGEIARRREQLGKFTDCDPRFAEAAEQYAQYFVVQHGKIPYIPYGNLEDFTIEGRLPAQATVALVGDWGTGQDVARNVLAQIARKNPDVVIHLGDIYYAGTQFEVDNYFWRPWQEILKLGAGGKAATFALSGNHDMYGGGNAYYGLLRKLGQPASYFCLRNAAWQFVALDTGFNGCRLDDSLTFLQDSELRWLTHKIQNAGGRKTVLLSHHQLFSAYEALDGHGLNDLLYRQIEPLRDGIRAWFWGHEHNLIIHDSYKGVLGRCVGHGAFPVGLDELPTHPPVADVPVANVQLGRGFAFYNHGYAILRLDGASAEVSYYQDSDETQPLFRETL